MIKESYDIEWNIALQYLERIILPILQQITQAFIDEDVITLHKFIDTYYINLKGQIENFDNELEIYKKIKDIGIKIRKIDRNNDGEIDELERGQASVILGNAFDELKDVWIQLNQIAASVGLTMQLRDIKEYNKRKVDKWNKMQFPIGDI